MWSGWEKCTGLRVETIGKVHFNFKKWGQGIRKGPKKCQKGFSDDFLPAGKRRQTRADPIQAEIDSIFSLYCTKTPKVKKKKRGGGNRYRTLLHVQPVVGDGLLGARQKDPLRNPTGRVSTNQQTNTHGGGRSKEEEATGSG